MKKYLILMIVTICVLGYVLYIILIGIELDGMTAAVLCIIYGIINLSFG
jgi:hypothetical protein